MSASMTTIRRETPTTMTRRARRWLPLLGAVVMGCAACGGEDPEVNGDPFELSDPPGAEADMREQVDMHTPAPTQDMRAVDEPDMRAPERDMRAPDGPGEMGSLDMRPDMRSPSLDMAPDMGPVEPLRRVIQRPLFGNTPLTNRFKDPRFASLHQSYDWLVTRGNQSFDLLVAYRKELAETPAQTPVLHVPKEPTNPNGLQVYGELMLQRAPTRISIWIGRPLLNVAGAQAQVSIYGLNTNNIQDFAGVELAPEPGSEQIMSGIRWVRYAAVAEGFAGYGYLIVQDVSSAPLYVHAPVAAPVEASPSMLRSWRVTSARVGTEEERERFGRVVDFVRKERQRWVPRQDRPLPNPF